MWLCKSRIPQNMYWINESIWERISLEEKVKWLLYEQN